MDIPIVNTIPAIPGKVKAVVSCAKIPKMKKMLNTNAAVAIKPPLP